MNKCSTSPLDGNQVEGLPHAPVLRNFNLRFLDLHFFVLDSRLHIPYFEFPVCVSCFRICGFGFLGLDFLVLGFLRLDSCVWIPAFEFLGLDSCVWIPGVGFLGLDSWVWNPGFGVLGLDSLIWTPGLNLL